MKTRFGRKNRGALPEKRRCAVHVKYGKRESPKDTVPYSVTVVANKRTGPVRAVKYSGFRMHFVRLGLILSVTISRFPAKLCRQAVTGNHEVFFKIDLTICFFLRKGLQ